MLFLIVFSFALFQLESELEQLRGGLGAGDNVVLFRGNKMVLDRDAGLYEQAFRKQGFNVKIPSIYAGSRSSNISFSGEFYYYISCGGEICKHILALETC